jgi:DNA-binding NtrC family response regulator
VDLAKAALKTRKELPIILCTGYSSEISQERSAVIGISRLITKPYGSHAIHKLIRDILDNKKKGAMNGKSKWIRIYGQHSKALQKNR